MKKIFYFIIALVFASSVQAQSDVIFTHFMFNKLNYNPGFTGNPDVLDVGAIYRNQWFKGIDGAPKTISIFGHTPLKDDASAVGLSITSDKIGFYETIAAAGSYAYRLEINNDSRLSIGLSARIEQSRLNWTLAQGVDPSDVLAGSTAQNNLKPNFGFGVYYKYKDYYAGISAPRLLKNSLYSEGSTFSPSLNTYYIMGGGTFELNDNVELLPNAMISLNPSAPFELDLNVNALFLKQFMIGAGYRLGDSFDVLAQYYFKQGFRVGAAYDFTVSGLNQKTSGSFEILLGFTLPCENCDIVHPRFL